MAQTKSLIDRIKTAPRVFDDEAAARTLSTLEEAGPLPAASRDLLAGVAGASPYLSRLMTRRRASLAALLQNSPEQNSARAIKDVRAAAALTQTPAQLKALRETKDLAALNAGLAEISGAWSTMEAADHWSRFADAAVGAAVDMALRDAGRKGFVPEDEENPAARSGFSVIAMGKLGGHELNYSSDIDLIALYDSESDALGDDPKSLAVSATRAMVSRLSDQTRDGYVFRTDLRLRPDPGVSAAAISFNAAEAYYEAYGQNWERAAYIKARACAGDTEAGEAFLARLRPFVWRKYLDFAAIEDVLSIMRQIHAAKGGAEIEFYGHDLKTGKGGIREIEFSAQTQQLILGGKDEGLRSRSTIETLGALLARRRIDQKMHDDLASAYRYLRKVEHRIQMIGDEQTHKIPETPEEAERLAAFLGEESASAFEEKLRRTLARTHEHFSALFEPQDSLSTSTGSLSFTGVEADKDTLRTLAGYGFERPENVADTIRRWHSGDLRATRTVRAREILTKLTPRLLEALSKAVHADEAFVAFDQFLRRLPSGVQIFSLLANNPAIFDRLIRIMTVSPFLGRALSRRAHLIEAMLEDNWSAPGREELENELAAALGRAQNFEEQLNAARRWGAEKKFQIAAQIVTEKINPLDAGPVFTMVAEIAIAQLLPAARKETRRLYGDIEGDIIVVAMGRLGADAMTADSDIDLIFIYETPDDAQSTGSKPLDGVSYFARLVRRFLTAITTVTEEGSLYEVDMRLRPSGGAGPPAVSFAAFHKYYQEGAWTWERQALVKARVIAGDERLAAKTDSEIERIFAAVKGDERLAGDIHAMRERLFRDKPPRSPWDLKRVIGGTIDIDFINQYLVLKSGERPPVRPFSVFAAIEYLKNSGAMTPEIAERLLTASELFETIMQVSRAGAGGVFARDAAGPAESDIMARACGAETIEKAEEMLLRMQEEVTEIYKSIIGAAVGDGTVSD